MNEIGVTIASYPCIYKKKFQEQVHAGMAAPEVLKQE